jgi:NADPH:quinone reductase-like Zn-dependent oxidoreductase
MLNPGLAAWKAVAAEGELGAGQSLLVLGATGASGRIAAQLGQHAGARVVAAGRNERVLGLLRDRGATAIGLGRPAADVAEALAAAGPYDLVVDYLWGEPAEAFFSALLLPGLGAAQQRRPLRYILVGMSAGQHARLPAMALRSVPVQIAGSGYAGQADTAAATRACRELLELAAAGHVSVDIETRPLAEVGEAWPDSDSGRRVVFIP